MDILPLIGNPILATVPIPIYYMFLAYFAFKILDFISGLLKTWKGVEIYQSVIMREGIIRWIGELVGIAFVLILDILFGLEMYLTGFTLALFLYKEAGSIIENLHSIGINLPEMVTSIIEIFKREK